MAYAYAGCFWFVLVFIVASIHQRRLLERLFKEHNPVERPVRNENETLLVTVSLSLQQIIDVVIRFVCLVTIHRY